MNDKQLLEQEIEAQYKALREMKPGSDVYKVTVDNLAKLIDRKIEYDRLAVEEEDKLITRESEEAFRQAQLKDERRNKIVTWILRVVEIGAPIALAIWGTKVSLKFEETGSITTIAGRSFIQKLFPRK